MTTHDPALLWAADRAGLPYDRFVTGLTPSTIQRIRAAYCRRNGTKILMPAVKTAQPAKTAPLAVDVTSDDSMAADMEAAQAVEQAEAAVEAAQADPETTLRAAFQAQMNKLPTEMNAWKYKRFLAAFHVTTKDEKNLLEKIVREEIRNVTEPMAIKLNLFLWWLEGQ